MNSKWFKYPVSLQEKFRLQETIKFEMLLVGIQWKFEEK